MFTKREVRCTNPDCGALNSVPTYSVRKIPRCGKCQHHLPESAPVKVLRKAYQLRGFLPLAIIVAFIAWAARDNIRVAVDDLIHPAAVCTVHPSPSQGIYRYYTPDDDVAAFTIKTALGSDYFVKLEDLSGQPVRSFFVHGGSTLANQVPLGTYVLKYATGTSWCNERDLFGPETTTKQADDIFSFKREATPDGYSLSHWTVELIRQPGGNLRTHSIPRSQF